MKVIQKAKTTPKTFTPHANACEHDCLAVCKNARREPANFLV